MKLIKVLVCMTLTVFLLVVGLNVTAAGFYRMVGEKNEPAVNISVVDGTLKIAFLGYRFQWNATGEEDLEEFISRTVVGPVQQIVGDYFK